MYSGRNRKITERLNAQEIILPDSMNVINADQIENPELLSTDGKMKSSSSEILHAARRF